MNNIPSNIKYKKHDLGYKTMSEAILSSEGIEFNHSDKIDYPIQNLTTINTLWNEEEFNKINLPKLLFQLNKEEINLYACEELIRVLDMPIKFPGSNYRLPRELAYLKPLIQKIAANEHLINDRINDYYCYITLDKRIVKQGTTTRKEGIHVDGFQGARLGKKLPIDHSYIVSNNHPTIFYNQPFEVKSDWDKTCHNYFEGFEQQKTGNSQVIYPNNSVLLIDAYCLHEAPPVIEDTFRTFLRLSYTVREFDRLGNAHNNMFDYEWEMHPRDIQKTLICPMNTGKLMKKLYI